LKRIILDRFDLADIPYPALRVGVMAVRKEDIEKMIGDREVIGYIQDKEILEEVRKIIKVNNNSSMKQTLGEADDIYFVSWREVEGRRVLQFWTIRLEFLPLLDLYSNFFDEE